VQQAQTNALLSMLNLNTPVEPSASTVSALGKAASGLKVPAASGPPVWKILVLDQETKDILATVLRVQDLREIGVTLHVYVLSTSCLVLGLVTIFNAKTTPLVSTTAV
jgi:sec1 family domain-containing protein 1